jgi:cell wall-associated NlpC family hydrolase
MNGIRGVALAWLAIGCSGGQGRAPGHAFRAGLLNDGDTAYASADEPEAPAPVRPAESPRARPAPARVAQGRKQTTAHFAEPSTRPAAASEAATPHPVARQPAVRPVASPPSATGHDAADALRATQRVDAAAALLGTPGLAERAFVAHVLRAAGQDVDVDRSAPYPKALHDKLAGTAQPVEHKEARPGDLVFFRDTADVNGNGKPDDGITMVGVVERVEGRRVVFIAQRANKVRRMAVDPTQPMVVRDAKDEVVNTRLVRWPGAQSPLTTGQCLVGYLRP